MNAFSPELTRKLFIASTVMMIVAVALSAFNAAAVLSAPLRTTTSVPSTVGFEGFLADAGGQPLPNGTYTLTFRAYDVATGGSVLWTEQQNSVQVTNGLYSVVLGASVPFTSNTFSGNRWVGVTVNTGTEISPRTQVSSVPFALNAESANKIGGGATAGIIALFDGPCPSGWTEYTAAQGRVIVGVPAGGTVGATVGTALTDREDRTHTHTTPEHKHLQNLGSPETFTGMWSGGLSPKVYVGPWGTPADGQPIGLPYSSSDNWTYSLQKVLTGTQLGGGGLNTSTATTGQIIPYIQLRYCKLNP